MPEFDDSFLFDCASFERKKWKTHQLRFHPSAVVLKSASNLDPFLDVDFKKAPVPAAPIMRQECAGYVAEVSNSSATLDSPGLGRRTAASRIKLFGGSYSSTYDVSQWERQDRQELSKMPHGQPFLYKHLPLDDHDETSRYDNGGSCTPATSTGSSSIGLTSTPVSSGRSSNSNSSNSNGGSSVTSTPTAGGHDQAAGGNSSASVTPGAPGSSGHKGSIRGNKLARRARSFKDDFLEKISQIRTPTSTMTRSHSPNSPRGGAGGSGANAASYGSRKSTTDEPAKPVQDLNYHVRQVKNALTHFKDVILKNKLEMLPGNGTVVLESIANVHTALQSYTLNEHSSAFINATNHVHVSLGNLLKLCDEVLLTKEGDDCPSLSKENVKEVVELVENAVNNLVNLANEKLSDRKAIGAGGSGGPGTGVGGTAAGHSAGGPSSNTLQRPTVDVVSQRTSLPDIPLTPRERDILEQTSLKTVRASHSTESILRDSSPPPPPKPPLPDRSQEPPPPLPPKRKSQHAKNHSFHDTTTASSDCASTDSTIFQLGGGPGSSAGGATGAGGSIGLDRMSLRSRSPEDNCSLLSASAGSLDSALNHSREEDELRALTSCSSHASATAASLGGLVILGAGASGCGTQHWEEAGDLAGGLPQHSNNSLNRNSNESGFESMYSLRVSRDQHQQQQQQQMHMQYQSTAATVTTHHHHQKSASSSSSSSSYVHKSESIVDGMAALVVASGKAAVQQQHLQQHHQAHVLHHQQHQQQQQHFHQKIDTIITQASDDSSAGPKGTSEQPASATSLTSTVTTSSSSSLSKLLVHGPSIDELGNDDVFPRTSAGGATDRPPALPVKTRSHSIKRERHPSQYDNVDEVDLERGSQDSFGHFPMQSSPSYLYSRQQMFHNLPSKHISLIEPRHMSRFQEEPPPLPIKKKHMFQSVAYSVMAYMEIFGSATQNQSEFMRHSVHTYNLAHSEQISTSSTTSNHSISHSQTMSLSPSRIAPATVSPPSSPNVSVKPPALPPKRQRINSKTPSIASTPPPSPKIFQDQQQHHHAQHHYHQQQAQAPNAINTSPSPSTSSLASTQSGAGGKPSAVCNQTLDAKTPKVAQPPLAASAPEAESATASGSAASTSTTSTTLTNIAATTTTTTTISSVGDDGGAAAAGAATEQCGIRYQSPNRRHPVGGQHAADDDYLHLCDATTRAPISGDNLSASSSSAFPSSASNLNLASTAGRGSGSTSQHLVSVTNHSHSNNTSGSSSNNVESSSYLNDSHNKGRTSSSSSGGQAVLPSSDAMIYEASTTPSPLPAGDAGDERTSNKDGDEVEVILRRNNKNGMTMAMEQQQQPLNLMEELDVSNYLVFKKENEDGPDVKGGHPDALIIHATRVQKNSDDDCLEDAYGEAFITTFRTFISPLDLIQKLSHRYTVYHCQMNDAKQKAAKESFSLLVRVVNDLTTPDLSERLLVILMNFDYQLVSAGHLTMAKLLRVKLIEKALIYKQKASLTVPTLSSRALVAQPPTLLDLKSAEIAEQMTLLDAELFQKIEIPEVLIWAQEQCEERSPNLTRFTEHFNKMSYWARTQILSQNDAKDREKHVIKFIKIMKHLRKINNYNSYLALLSALDSAPIRRLEWHKTITEGLKEYCALIDSSSSFRAYRQALAETNPPCIPYIGLVLQDLTFVHIGNPDLLPDGSTNFSKRWQQYHIVVNMKRFKKGSYPFKKNERIIGFFDNFEYYLDEDAMWQISETIKPRGSRKANVN
ncbi:guanine nucleotide-releasing factor 2 isoform X1 [Anopheles merus]|uniref:guanine nucleotide-releasing factor 2 isoform X1 n=1 Tax=Anopheles merus TaxID=30066 RepID=UPI001BE3DBC2|nr:guanine nucleotide-releasing factor 2 isoform X1 [Anopheles merus]XP_041773016.1 guanine nucleotide-releasing factor 2 isoform X1 [Anopheles merus]XP_041781258.1 guanine nucleotide-releasing factor 2 isoform X1 [Anopheles merus]